MLNQLKQLNHMARCKNDVTATVCNIHTGTCPDLQPRLEKFVQWALAQLSKYFYLGGRVFYISTSLLMFKNFPFILLGFFFTTSIKFVYLLEKLWTWSAHKKSIHFKRGKWCVYCCTHLHSTTLLLTWQQQSLKSFWKKWDFKQAAYSVFPFVESS